MTSRKISTSSACGGGGGDRRRSAGLGDHQDLVVSSSKPRRASTGTARPAVTGRPVGTGNARNQNNNYHHERKEPHFPQIKIVIDEPEQVDTMGAGPPVPAYQRRLVRAQPGPGSSYLTIDGPTEGSREGSRGVPVHRGPTGHGQRSYYYRGLHEDWLLHLDDYGGQGTDAEYAVHGGYHRRMPLRGRHHRGRAVLVDDYEDEEEEEEDEEVEDDETDEDSDEDEDDRGVEYRRSEGASCALSMSQTKTVRCGELTQQLPTTSATKALCKTNPLSSSLPG
ncbi:uncharacterized protein LOC118465797 [Anopheles albimanus]|uniref:uncharacterized protein LOC118465797 n=1 Tax=Anopheles albimanus TaxID=7167 RepID=UPI001641A4E7|nr:uncharacterized protein LOC118465797 [Anopheles albimanus]XP_035790254.1 uncharacterized protein LOC118465797 [Anopheles albimanus]